MRDFVSTRACVCLDLCVILSRLVYMFVSTRVCFVHLLDCQQEADREGHEDGDQPGQKDALPRDVITTVVAVVWARAPGNRRTL